MSKDPKRDAGQRAVVQMADFRRRQQEEKEDIVSPIRAAFMEDLGELLDEYFDTVEEATGGDIDKAMEELMAACSIVLSITAEDYFEDVADQVEFIESAAEIAIDLVTDDSQGELFDDPQT